MKYTGQNVLTQVFQLIKSKFDGLSTVATTGSYNDLKDLPIDDTLILRTDVSITQDSVSQINIPFDEGSYDELMVYLNGLLLIKNTHYTQGTTSINLTGYAAKSGDTFTFVNKTLSSLELKLKSEAILSESWAVGGTSSRSGEDTNNSKYYAEQSGSSSRNAQQYAQQAQSTFNNFTQQSQDILNDFTEQSQGALDSLNKKSQEIIDSIFDVSQHASDTDIHVTTTEKDIWDNKCNKSKVINATLLASGWTGDTVPYTYNLSVSGVTTNSNQDLLPPLNPSEEIIKALQGANIQEGSQSNGNIVLKAFGTKPEIDLPIRVILRGDM